MRWPWQRRETEPVEYPHRALRDAERRFWRAVGETEAIDRRAAELARDLPAGVLYMRLVEVFRRGDP
jgi:hypothetical protein